MKKSSKLSYKLLLPLILSVVFSIILVAGISLTISGYGMNQLSMKYSDTLARDYSRQVEEQLALTLNTAEALSADIHTMMEEEDTERSDILLLVNSTLSKHKELVGIGVGFEPNAFDGKDSENAGEKHSDEAGRFVPYTFRNGTEIDYTILDGYDDPGPDGSWYSVPKSTKKTYVTAPYWYEVNGQQSLIVTCVAPILDDNGTFIGMVGFDTLLSSLSGILEGAKIYDTGYLVMMSPDGTIAYHPDSALNGKSIYDSLPAQITDLADQVYKSGEVLMSTIKSTITGKKSLSVFIPIQVGESGGNWIVATSTPTSEIFRIINFSIFLAACLGIVVIILIVLVLLRLVKVKVLKPVQDINAAAGSLADGNLNVQINYESDDELGQLSESIRRTGSQLNTYVNNISQVLGNMSQGDFSSSVQIDYIGDLAPIKTSINRIIEQLNLTLMQIKTTADQVSDGAHEVAAGAQALSQGATEQASSIEELAAAINGISTQITESTANAQDSSQKACSVGHEMTSSNQQMQEMILAMNEISQSSSEIGKIIKTIEDIAFQTNILALNAAVEAARAGAAGKGFAVVADEVRNLANKSAEASKNTSAFIEGSLKAVENGTRIADQTAQSLVLAVEGAKVVADTINKVSDVSVIQAQSIREITVGIDQISSVVQNNSATAEESAASSEELSGQAQMLKDLVGQFKLKDV